MRSKSRGTRRDFVRMGGAMGVTGLGLLAGMGAVSVPARASGAPLQRVRIVNTGGNSNQVLQDLPAAGPGAVDGKLSRPATVRASPR
jgi:hypothetical protein